VNLLGLYEKVEKLVHKLPESLQSPILREISPMKSVFLLGRPPRLLLLGDRGASRTALVNALFRSNVARASEDHVQDGAWQLFARKGRGSLRVLDARRPASLSLLRRALGTEAPDACIFLHLEPRDPSELAADLDHALQVQGLTHTTHEAQPPVFAVALGSAGGVDPATAREHLHRAIDDAARQPFGNRVAGIFVLQGETSETDRLAAAIAAELPAEAKLEWARLSGVREVQRDLAQVVVRSVSAICGAIGAQPIPLADFPIITSLQVAMVAGVMHISGREMSRKLAMEFMGAVGANIGVGLALREGARAAMKVVPVWGNLVAGGVAAAGTFAVGKAATEYFIEGGTLADARQLFRRQKKEAPRLGDRHKK
jgi:uncharacterized protein (DUF697 family)